MSNHNCYMGSLLSGGFFSQDPDGIYCNVKEESNIWRYRILENPDEPNSRHFWSEPTSLISRDYLKSIAKEFPKAVILKKLKSEMKENA